jgi:HAD superfamily hydrolase (TIGR01484 family)
MIAASDRTFTQPVDDTCGYKKYTNDMKYKHLFFDMDKTIAPSRQPILPDMFDLLSSLSQDIIIVSGQDNAKIAWQSSNLPAIKLGQNGNHAVDLHDAELWNFPLTDPERTEIMAHIAQVTALLPEQPKPEWVPVEDRGAQITFSPIGNQAPVDVKYAYDPDMSKRFKLMEQVPFESEDLVVKIGGSTSFDYFPRDRNKGTNVQRLIDLMGWNADECIYYGDGLFPGGNDEAVIGVIETVAVKNHIDTYQKLQAML